MPKSSGGDSSRLAVRDQELERERPGEVRKNSDFTESRELDGCLAASWTDE